MTTPMFRSVFLLEVAFTLLAVGAGDCLAFQNEPELKSRELLQQLESATDTSTSQLLNQIAEIGLEARAAAPHLFEKMKTRDTIGAAAALASIGPEIVPELRTALQTDALEYQKSILNVIGRMQSDAAPLVPEVIELLDHRDESIRLGIAPPP